MATGFGVMMIGPAGSGKVGMTHIFLIQIFNLHLVYFMSCIARNW